MKSLLIILMPFIFFSCIPKESKINERYKTEGIGQIEMYDFEKTEDGTKRVVYEHDEWVIDISKMSDWAVCYEYAPAIDFYEILKYYHPNGMIRERGRYMLDLPFGEWEYFDKKGNLIKVEDEDIKFEGAEITKEYIVKILEIEGWFNRKTGENNIFSGNKKVLKTNGEFYMNLRGNITIAFESVVYENGIEKKPPLWYVTIITEKILSIRENTLYVINGHTGEYSIEFTSVQLDI